MPNFWTRTVQKIKESIDGPRTNDKDLLNKIEEMNQVQKALINLKKIVNNFTSYFEKIMCYNREIIESIFLLFHNNKEYNEFANILTSVHVDNNKLFESIINEISHLTKETQDWDKYYSSVEILINEREESRKVYDHYEKKLEKLEDKKEQKIKEGSYTEGSDFYTIITRNEIKYINAKDDYVKKAISAYDTIDKLNNDRFNIVTPVLLDIFFVEMKLYESFSAKYKDYKDIENTLKKMENEFLRKPKNVYNPMTFTKSPYLEQKFENIKKKRDFKSSSPNNFRKKSFKNDEDSVVINNHINNLRKKPSKEISEEDKNFDYQQDKDVNISSSQSFKKSSKKIIESIGEFTVNEFNKIGNNYYIDSSIFQRENLRNDSLKLTSNKIEKNQINFKNFPIINSINEEEFYYNMINNKKSIDKLDNFSKSNLKIFNNISFGQNAQSFTDLNENYDKLIPQDFNYTSNLYNPTKSQQIFASSDKFNYSNQFNINSDFTQKPKINNNVASYESDPTFNPNKNNTMKNTSDPKYILNNNHYQNISKLDINKNKNIGKKSQPEMNVSNTTKFDPFEGFY